MNHISTWRMYLLRALYLLIAVGLGLTVWPDVLHQDTPWTMSRGIILCMLSAFSLLCALGIRYPLQMLPVLLWEVLWKTMWLVLVALPAWLSGQVSPAIAEQAFGVGMVILVYAAVPWDYVYRHYVKKAGDHWRGAPSASQSTKLNSAHERRPA